MTINSAIFTAETVAHTQGLERKILPITDQARSDVAAIIAALNMSLAYVPVNKIADIEDAIGRLQAK